MSEWANSQPWLYYHYHSMLLQSLPGPPKVPLWGATVGEATRRSSRYTNTWGTSARTLSNTRWNIWPAFLSPKGILRNSPMAVRCWKLS